MCSPIFFAQNACGTVYSQMVTRILKLASILVLGLLGCWSISFANNEISGPVIAVFDGDTIEVLYHRRPVRVRLHGIDCPETGQAFGAQAKRATSALVFGKTITLRMYGQDRYQRILADALLPDGKILNHELVESGWCWWYRKYAPGDTVLERLEQNARERRIGLWSDPAPQPPWEWRKRVRSSQRRGAG